jgi:predicted DNA-binding protein (MmcQ/YjbR family)
MEIDEIRDHLLGMPGARESTPFGEDTLVYKVGGKMFALIGIEWLPPRVNLKCDPERAIELREAHPEGVLPGYHMNKSHWNTVVLTEVPRALVLELCEHSRDLVVAGLTRKARAALNSELNSAH